MTHRIHEFPSSQINHGSTISFSLWKYHRFFKRSRTSAAVCPSNSGARSSVSAKLVSSHRAIGRWYVMICPFTFPIPRINQPSYADPSSWSLERQAFVFPCPEQHPQSSVTIRHSVIQRVIRCSYSSSMV